MKTNLVVPFSLVRGYKDEFGLLHLGLINGSETEFFELRTHKRHKIISKYYVTDNLYLFDTLTWVSKLLLQKNKNPFLSYFL